MDTLEQLNYINELMDIYSELLTKKQQEYLELYYKENLSLQEIAEIHAVSRNAVHDGINKARALLEMYESHLKIISVTKARKKYIVENISDLEVQKKLLSFELL